MFKQLEKLEIKKTNYALTVKEEKIDKKKFVHFPLNINLELRKGTYKKNEHSDILITKFKFTNDLTVIFKSSRRSCKVYLEFKTNKEATNTNKHDLEKIRTPCIKPMYI